MLKKLVLQNFQCHNKLVIEFDPSITTIVGSSDSGKSSIIRSLYWAAFNNPSGSAFIRSGSTGCSVTIQTDLGVVKRRRGKSVNQYVLNGKELSAIGRSVPKEVSDVLRLSTLNFQNQHDSPLWLSESPSQVAKNLNEIVDLDLLDKVQKNLNRRVKFLLVEKSVYENKLRFNESEIKELEWVETAKMEFDVIDRLEEELKEQEKRTKDIADLRNSLVETRRRIKSAKESIDSIKSDSEEVSKAISDFSEAEKTATSIKVLLDDALLEWDRIHYLQQQVEEKQKILATQRTCPFCGSVLSSDECPF